jgi:hypothetical protein
MRSTKATISKQMTAASVALANATADPGATWARGVVANTAPDTQAVSATIAAASASPATCPATLYAPRLDVTAAWRR